MVIPDKNCTAQELNFVMNQTRNTEGTHNVYFELYESEIYGTFPKIRRWMASHPYFT